jgi:hypothetical protein
VADPHQVMTIMTNAICDCRKEYGGDGKLPDPEEAKHIAKCIWMALADAGLDIVPSGGKD